MRSFWSDPYLWVHLAGLAAVPLLAEVCLVGLAVGDPWLPVGLEVLLVGAAGIAPVLWMQWQRPFCIFSLTPLALRPDALSDERRRMLHLFTGTEVRVLAGSAAIALFILLWQLFRFAPVATEAAAILPQNRALGLLIAAVAFLLCNLFVQVPLSVIRVLLSSDGAIAQYAPYTPAEVAKSFTIPGFRVKQILPDWVAAAPHVPPAVKRDSQSDAYENRPQRQPAAPFLADETLDESPWDEPEPSVSESPIPEPVPPELATPELATPELLTPELPLEDSTPLPEQVSEASQKASQEASQNASQEASQLENAQPTSFTEGAIAPEQDSLADPSDPSPGADPSTPAAPPNHVDVEALVAEALEAVDAELLREMPDPLTDVTLTDVTLTDNAEAAVDSLERPPTEEL